MDNVSHVLPKSKTKQVHPPPYLIRRGCSSKEKILGELAACNVGRPNHRDDPVKEEDEKEWQAPHLSRTSTLLYNIYIYESCKALDQTAEFVKGRDELNEEVGEVEKRERLVWS